MKSSFPSSHHENGPDSDDLFDVDIQACSACDCTGLIPSLPADDAQQEYYEELYPYTPKTTNTASKK